MKYASKCARVSALCVLVSTQLGCVSEKVVLRCSDGLPPFNVTVKAESAPFSDDPNTYWHLRVPDISYSSGQISNLLIFWLERDGLGFLSEDIDGKWNLLIPAENRRPKRLETISDFYANISQPLVSSNIAFTILAKRLLLSNVQCAYFHWNSGGIYYWGYERIEDGVQSCIGRRKSAENSRNDSGYVPFMDWNQNMRSWPEALPDEQKGVSPIRTH